MTTCPCSTSSTTYPGPLRERPPKFFAHCQAIARKYNLYELATFHTTVTSTIWDPAEQMWKPDHGPWRTYECALRHLRQRHPLQAQAREDQRPLERLRGHSFHTSRMGLRIHQAGCSQASKTRTSASSGPERQPYKPSPAWARRPKSFTSSNAPHLQSTSATTGRPIPTWARRLAHGLQAKRRARARMNRN